MCTPWRSRPEYDQVRSHNAIFYSAFSRWRTNVTSASELIQHKMDIPQPLQCNHCLTQGSTAVTRLNVLPSQFVKATALPKKSAECLELESWKIAHILCHRERPNIPKLGIVSIRYAGGRHCNIIWNIRIKEEENEEMTKQDVYDQQIWLSQDNDAVAIYNKSQRASNLTGMSLNYCRRDWNVVKTTRNEIVDMKGDMTSNQNRVELTARGLKTLGWSINYYQEIEKFCGYQKYPRAGIIWIIMPMTPSFRCNRTRRLQVTLSVVLTALMSKLPQSV